MGQTNLCEHRAPGAAVARDNGNGDYRPQERGNDEEKVRVQHPHAKFASTNANVRSRAGHQLFKYLSGKIPKLPPTVAEIYGKLVNQVVTGTLPPDLNEKLDKSVKSNKETLVQLRSDLSVHPI